MIIRIIDIGKITQFFKPYQDGIKEIEIFKKNILTNLEPFKKELNTSILNGDEVKINEIYNKIKNIEYDSERDIKKMNTSLNDDVFNQLSNIINKWSLDNGIDIVINNMDIIFYKKEIDATDIIIELIKERNIDEGNTIG